MKVGLPANGRKRGSSLVATFWLIATLGMVIFGATRFISVDGHLLAARKAGAYARAQAETGLAIGSHDEIRIGDPLLVREFDDGGGYAVILSTEESRLNVNELLKRNQSAVLVRLFRSHGIGEMPAASVVDAMKDWIDADDLPSLNGAERGAYPNAAMPYNRPFVSIEEMMLVRGMNSVEEVWPDWREAFSMFAAGGLDVNTAGADVLAAVTDVDESAAEVFVNIRAGLDRIAGTLDDRKFATVPEALVVLGVSRERMAALDSMLTVDGKTRRVESVGRFGDHRKKLVMIRRGASILWRGEVAGALHGESEDSVENKFIERKREGAQ